MTVTAPDSATPMQLVAVPDGMGGQRHEWRPIQPDVPKPKRKKRRVPDPIQANPDAEGKELKGLIERIERLEEEKQGITDDIKDVYSEGKARGYDTKTLRQIVSLRKLDTNLRRESEMILETYKSALGIV